MSELRVVAEPERPFYTIRSLAQRLSVTERTIRNILARGELRSYRVCRTVRIDPDDVDRYLAERCEDRAA
jgi:excisionase family DNA binding protein